MKRKLLLFYGFLIAAGVSAQQETTATGPEMIDGPTFIMTASSFKETKALNLLFSQDEIDKMDFEKAKEMPDREYRKPQTFKYSTVDGPEYGNDSISMQFSMGTKEPKNVISSWTGLSGGYSPEDPTGAAGLTQYVQAVNATPFAVYDKSGNGTPVFTGSVGSVTGAGNDGDPIVLYDKFADRWFVAELDGWFGFALAVSQTNDPTGSWYAYQFNAPQMPDYLKFSVWENGYYMTSNNGSGTVYCFERAAMLNGDPGARAIHKNFTEPSNAGFGFWLPLAADADGVIPPSGERCPFFAYTDNGWGGGATDAVKVWSMGVTWGATPAADITLDATIPTSAFDASYDNNWNDITQPGSQKLDGLGGVCMYRAQWSSFIGTNRVVLNWGVKISATQRSIMWVELRQDQASGTWSLFQEGIYTPDAASRWCGSIAMDCNGDIALCYAKASSTIPASLAYTGRLASDPLGTMTLTETVVFPGTGSLTGSNRFGDYAHTSIDPVDGNTFWHTGMYANNGSETGIYSFQIDDCTVGLDNEETTETEFAAYYTNGMIDIKVSGLPFDDEYIVQLFEISGKKISESKIKSSSGVFESAIDASGLVPGVYLVRIGTPDYQKVVKVAVQ